MAHLFSFSLLSAITLTVLWLAYRFSLKGEHNHRLNRIALWGMMLIAISVPLLPAIDIFAPAYGPVIPADIQVGTPTASAIGDVEEITNPNATSIEIFRLLSLTYIIGVCVMILTGCMSLLRLLRLIHSGETIITPDGTTVTLVDDGSIAPFSFMHHIVMSRSDYTRDGMMIICHESAHISQHHFIDLIAIRAICALQWYNPAAWLMATETAAVHEYLADRQVLESGADSYRYQQLLVERATGLRYSSLTNSLNNSKLKNRITMMRQNSPAPMRALRALALIPAIATAIAITNIPAIASTLRSPEAPLGDGGKLEEIVVVGYSDKTPQPAQGTDVDTQERVYDMVEVMPQYPGGENELMKFIAQNIRYPQVAFQAGVQGRVVVQFIVGTDGAVKNPTVKRSVSPELDAEACRVVASLPPFTPGKMNGENVAVHYVIPIAFRITNDKENKAPDPAFFVDGKRVNDISKIKSEDIQSMDIIKDDPEFPYGKLMITLKK